MEGREGSSSSSAGQTPKKKGFDPSIFLKPIADFPTSAGKIYLFSLRVSDLLQFEKLAANEPLPKFRNFLPYIASLSPNAELEKNRESLTSELVAQLSDEEVEAIAEVYVASTALQASRVGTKDKSGLTRENRETATVYVDRLLKKEIQDHTESVRPMLASSGSILNQAWKSISMGNGMDQARKSISMGNFMDQVRASDSRNNIFDQVRKSSSLLESKVSEFERLVSPKVQPAISISATHTDLANHMAEHHAKMARERAEELKMARLTGEMTAQSATTLNELAKAATKLLEDMAARDNRSDQVTHNQLSIAVGSVFVSAFLALVALLYASVSYYQDKENNLSNDKWQAQVLSSINEGYRQQKSIEEENKQLRAKVDALSDAVSRNKVAGASISPISDGAIPLSVARPVKNLDSTLPLPKQPLLTKP